METKEIKKIKTAEYAMYSKMDTAVKGSPVRVKEATNGAVGYTSGDGSIYLSWDHPCMAGLNDNGKRAFRYGVNTHELMHQMLTNFTILNRTAASLPHVEREIFATLHNVVEDARIEHFAYQFVGGAALKSLEFAISWTYKNTKPIQKEETAYGQYFNALIQLGDLGFLQGHFTFPEAKKAFMETAPLFYKATLETNPRRVAKYCKDIFEISRPLWKDRKDIEELQKKLKEAAEAAGKSFSSTGGNPSSEASEEDGSEESATSSRRRRTVKEVSRREYEKAAEGGSGKGKGSGGSQAVKCKDAETAEEAKEAAEEAAEDAAMAKDAAREAEEKAKADGTEASKRAAERAKAAAERAQKAADEAAAAAAEAEKAKAEGNTEAEKAAAKSAGRAALRANAALKSAENAATGAPINASTAQDAKENASSARDAADEAAKAAKEAREKAEAAKGTDGEESAEKAAEAAEKAAKEAEEAAENAEKAAKAAEKAQNAGDEIGEETNAEKSSKAAKDARRAAEKAKRAAEGKTSTPGEKANDAIWEDANNMNPEAANPFDSEVTDRAINGARPDYSNCEDEIDEGKWDTNEPTEFDFEDYALTDDDFASIETEVKSAIETLEKATAEDEEDARNPLPDFDIRSARIAKATTCLNRRIKVDDTDRAYEIYSELMARLRPGINSLYERLKNIFQNDLEIVDKRASGKLNYKRVNSGRMTARVFDKHRLPSEKAKAAIMILVDESGSMSGSNSQTAKETAISLSEVFARLNIPTYVIGFTADTSGADAVHNHYVTWKNTPNERLRLLDITARANNFDGYSIRYGAEILRKVNAEHKLMIVVSDGSPACHFYCGIDGIADTKDAIRATRTFADVFGVLIGGYEVEALQSMYGNDFINVRNVKELYEKLAARIVRIVNRWE